MARWLTGVPPKKKGRYLVTQETEFGRQVHVAYRMEFRGEFSWTVPGSGYTPDECVVAWQKYPEPYRGKPNKQITPWFN